MTASVHKRQKIGGEKKESYFIVEKQRKNNVTSVQSVGSVLEKRGFNSPHSL